MHFLLGPATVALAVPLYQQFRRLRQLWLPVAISLISGVVIAAGSSVGLARLLGGSLEIQMSLAPKSATAPVAPLGWGRIKVWTALGEVVNVREVVKEVCYWHE